MSRSFFVLLCRTLLTATDHDTSDGSPAHAGVLCAGVMLVAAAAAVATAVIVVVIIIVAVIVVPVVAADNRTYR